MLMCHKRYKIAFFCGLSPPLNKSRTEVTVCDRHIVMFPLERMSDLDGFGYLVDKLMAQTVGYLTNMRGSSEARQRRLPIM
jgi:hypothetical protein